MKRLIFVFLAILVLFPYVGYTQVDSTFFHNYSEKFNNLNEDLKNYIKKCINLDDYLDNIDLRIAEIQRHEIDRCNDILQYMFYIYSMFGYIYNEVDKYNYENLILKSIAYSKSVINALIINTNINLEYTKNQSVIKPANDFKKFSREILEQFQEWETNISEKHKK